MFAQTEYNEILNENIELKKRIEELEKQLKKKTKTKTKTKKRISAYNMFMKEKYNEVKKNSPKMVFSEISKEVGKQWKEINKKEINKKEWQEKADKFNLQNKNDSTDEDKSKVKPKKKRARNGYIHFYSTQYNTIKEKNPELKGKEIMKKASELWKEFNDEEKNDWKSKAQDFSNSESSSSNEEEEKVVKEKVVKKKVVKEKIIIKKTNNSKKVVKKKVVKKNKINDNIDNVFGSDIESDNDDIIKNISNVIEEDDEDELSEEE